jgi:hypothetical protein
MQVAAWNSCNDSWTCPEITVEVRCTFCFSGLSYPQLSTYCSMEVNCQILSTELKLQKNHRTHWNMTCSDTAGYFRTTICLPFLSLYESLHINGILTPGVTAYPSHDITNSEPLKDFKARLQTFRSNHAVAPLSLPCIPWIPGEKTCFSQRNVETGQETVWSNAGEGVKLLNLLMIMYCFHPSLHSSSSDQPSSFGCSWKENQEKGWTNCTYRTASQTMVATCCHTCACRT